MQDKEDSALRTIGEVAEELHLPAHVLRFWETKFSQLKPNKRRGRHRYYRPEDIETLKEIRHLLYEQGFTIKGAQKHLRTSRRHAEITQNDLFAYQPSAEPQALTRLLQATPAPAEATPAPVARPQVSSPKPAISAQDVAKLKGFLYEISGLKEKLQKRS